MLNGKILEVCFSFCSGVVSAATSEDADGLRELESIQKELEELQAKKEELEKQGDSSSITVNKGKFPGVQDGFSFTCTL